MKSANILVFATGDVGIQTRDVMLRELPLSYVRQYKWSNFAAIRG